MKQLCVGPCLLSLLLPCLVPGLSGLLLLLPGSLQHSAQAAQAIMGKKLASLGEWESPISSELIVSKVMGLSCKSTCTPLRALRPTCKNDELEHFAMPQTKLHLVF
jgi:hypothetical protein